MSTELCVRVAKVSFSLGDILLLSKKLLLVCYVCLGICFVSSNQTLLLCTESKVTYHKCIRDTDYPTYITLNRTHINLSPFKSLRCLFLNLNSH